LITFEGNNIFRGSWVTKTGSRLKSLNKIKHPQPSCTLYVEYILLIMNSIERFTKGEGYRMASLETSILFFQHTFITHEQLFS